MWDNGSHSLKKVIDHELSSLNFKGGLSLIFMCRLNT